MEVKINKEIREYTENMYFGMTLRQFIFALLACICSVGIYFIFSPILGTETVSWLCILGALPFVALGFLKYNHMTAEKFLVAWVKSEILIPKKLLFKANNIYYELLKKTRKEKSKNDKKPI